MNAPPAATAAHERVQKILSQWGIASRRQAEKMILAGRVKVNGAVIPLGTKANPQCDHLEVDGRLVTPENKPDSHYFLLHKPVGVICSCDDPRRRTTVLDLLPKDLQRGQGIHPVGRLDYNSSGAILLTNDGELTLRLTHPRYHLPKTYQVWVAGVPPESTLNQWRSGCWLDGQKTLPAQVRILKTKPTKTLLEIILTEGRNRQIRRVAQQLGFPVLKLHRLAIGKITLHGSGRMAKLLPPGGFRPLAPQEKTYLLSPVQLTDRPCSGV